MDKVAIYLHWPFCLAKCPYCDFVSYPSLIANTSEYEMWLLRDLQESMKLLDIGSISSVFFGGGTPSLMSACAVSNVLNLLSPKLLPNAEISLEANPATFDGKKLLDFRKAGINRLSLGVQSFRNKNLKFLGRVYCEEQSKNAADLVANIFDNFSFDFMYGYQPISEVISDLKQAVKYGVKHISCYQLTLEPGTPFFAYFSRTGKVFEDNDTCMSLIDEFLLSSGIFRYEVSNFSVPNYESKHNLTYWTYGNYLGCGPSAHSRVVVGGKKHAMVKSSNLKYWRNEIGQWDVDKILSYEEQLEEMIITGLRKISGIKFSELLQRIPKEIVLKIITPEKIKFLQEQNLIYHQPDVIKLTSEGMIKLDSVVEKILI